MNVSRKWTISVLAFLSALLIGAASLVAYIDPFFFYHKPLEGMAYNITSRPYQNPGIVRNFEYDAVISGSSMTENFRPSWFSDLMGLNAVKVPYSGARCKNINLIVGMALKRNPEVKKVFWGIDNFALENPEDETRDPLPQYLYNENPFDDVNYLLNKTVIFNHVRAILKNTRQGAKTTSLDDAYTWGSDQRFSEQAVLNSFTKPYPKPRSNDFIDENYYILPASKNLDVNIVPLIRQYPNVEFYFFFPPYSILYWYDLMQNNKLEAALKEQAYVISQLLQYPNVRIFYFQNREEITTNLFHYKDYYHYNAAVNYNMVQCFKNGQYMIAEDNYRSVLTDVYNLTHNFDYSIYWGDTVPFKKEKNIYRYLDMLRDERYIIAVSARDEASKSIDEEITRKLRAFGLGVNLNGKYRWSYIALIDGGKCVYEKAMDEPLSFQGVVSQLKFEVLSQGLNCGDNSSIQINDIEYSQNGRGLNFVVYDKLLGRVVDSVCFDTYADLTAART